LTSANVSPGTRLVIPPVNGIVYTVKAGDTPASLATRFNANADQIIAYNDAEITGLQVGEQILIPNATQQTIGGTNGHQYRPRLSLGQWSTVWIQRL